MFQSQGSRLAAALFSVLLSLSCSSVAEWEEAPGRVELFATPLPPVAGELLVLGLRASNVGPIEVVQGETVIATFFNIDLKELKAYEVRAASSETPRAEAVGFDYKRIKVTAAAFDRVAPAVEPDLSPDEADAGTTE